ncbi:MAG: hypothetical protein IKE66_06215 [Hyphomicrobium sp.]|nr:hypothetical protein [Hyphomicrobium sp.]
MRIWVLLIASTALSASTAPARALSWSVQMNCASDYYAYCSKHVAGSAGCHACMNTSRSKLSSACVSALIDDGIIPKTDITRQTSKFAVSKPIAARPVKAMPAPEKIVKAQASKIAAAKRTLAPSAQKPVRAALAIDQKTFEAFKNRAPYFVPAPEDATASIAAPE